MIYAAIYEDSCEIGFEAAKESGLRVILGEMMMDLGSYGQLQPKKVVSVSLLESERLCRKWHRAEDGRLEYAFSPRFAVTCSEKLMRSGGEMAARFDAYGEWRKRLAQGISALHEWLKQQDLADARIDSSA